MLSDFAGLVKAGSREDRLLGAIKWDRLPRHVAIIMDGNGRWAAQRGQPRIAGHRAGVEAVRAAVDTGARLGLGALTLYAFSTENWKRPRYEIDALMRMLRRYLRIELDEIDKQNIRFQTIGRTGVLAKNVRAEIEKATERTARNTGILSTTHGGQPGSMGHRFQLAAEGIPRWGSTGSAAYGRGRSNLCYHVRAGQPYRGTATLGRHGLCQGSVGVAGSLLRCEFG